MFTNLIQTNLTTSVLGKNIEHYTWTESTNIDAWKLIDEGIDEGTVIVTDKQTDGKGRAGREWISVSGKSLTASIILKPGIDSHQSGWFPILAGIAIVNALSKLGLIVKLKWPNDIIVNNKKLGGILCESRVRGKTLEWVVIGIGLNINEQNNELPTELNATSFFTEKLASVQRELVLAKIINHLEQLYIEFRLNKKINHLMELWTDHCNHVNKTVRFEIDNKTLTGEFMGINSHGSAIIKTNGNEKIYTSGDIHLVQS
jgi:BirA family biotin operon repressor/biotin-[acetyl-CoA-carboxylase] ligase